MIKTRLFSTSLVIYFSTITVLFSGCNDETNTITKSSKHVGYLMNFFDDNIKYQCANKMKALGKKGEFSCATFPIVFYIDSEKLGEVYSLHSDGYVFPQDIVRINQRDENIKVASR